MFYLLIICTLLFSILVLAHSRFGYSALMTLGIGSAIGANFYNEKSFAFDVFGYPTSMEACLFTLFIFCVVLSFAFYGKKIAVTLLVTVICATLFTTLLEFLAISISIGLPEAFNRLAEFAANIFSFALSGFTGIVFYNNLSNKLPTVLKVLLFVLMANIVKFIIQNIYLLITQQTIFLVGSYIAVLTTLVFCGISYIVISQSSLTAKKIKIYEI